MNKFGGKSCAKIIPVEVYRSDNPDRRLKVYALMDDQSNRTLGKSELFDYFGSTSVSDFTLSTCSGKSQASGRKLSGLVVESLDKQTQFNVPDILECNLIPDSKDEIPTQEVVLFHNHLSDLVEFIEPLDEEISIFPPCTSELKIDEVRTLEVNESAYDNIGKDVFIRHGNPADLATRSIIPSKLENSIWLSGPVIKIYADQTIESFSLINPDTDNEIRPDITTRKTTSLEKLSLGSQRFEKFGNQKAHVRSIALIKNFLVNRISKETRCQFRDAEMLVVGVVQNEIFSDEIDSRNSHITQISATSDKGSINTYVLPKKPITPKAQEITGIKVEGSKMFCHDKEPHITVLNETYDGHDSMEDVVALSRLFHHLAPSTEAKQLSSFSFDSAARRYDHNQKQKLLLPTLTPRAACTEKKVITLRTTDVMA
ncbi:unnamed protein product [Mytilus edulis]|uniref:Uncharacterized protein n=1 Tax=Mytilus edulis TaxID=6550 RepID=A0A8S3QZ92_MYTED|nr:unnamed protein product [Mytilus edulis]